jgi:hypothetical protein
LQFSFEVYFCEFVLHYFCDVLSGIGGKDDVLDVVHLEAELG